MKTLVIGGGIGGLSAAICLAMRGHEVHIYERSGQMGEAGAGLQISPNGMKIIEKMGVRLEGEFPPEAIEMRDAKTGREIFHLPMKPLVKRWGAPYVNIHRADLVNALLKRIKTLPITHHLNHNATHHFGNTVHFENGNTAEGDLIIGADGLWSKIAKSFQNFIHPKFSGYVAWRAVVPLSKLNNPPPPCATVWKQAGSHFVTTRVDGGDSVNFVSISQEKWFADNHNGVGDIETFEQVFGEIDSRLMDVAVGTDVLHKYPLMYRDIPKKWYEDCAVLLGDAVHPMLPSMAQGAVMAIEDAWVLASVLTDDLPASFDQYQKLREKRVRHVVKRSFANVKWFHRGGALRTAEDFVFRNASLIYPEVIYRQLDRVYAYEMRKLHLN